MNNKTKADQLLMGSEMAKTEIERDLVVAGLGSIEG